VLVSELNCLRGELQQVREDRDRLHLQVNLLIGEIERYKESTGKSVAELDNLMIKSNALEVCLPGLLFLLLSSIIAQCFNLCAFFFL